MGKLTAFLGLFIPEKTDRGKVVTEVFEPNFQKLDDNAKEVDTALKEIDKEIENIKKTEITTTGALSSNGNLGESITIEHKTGAGYNHIPAGGVVGQVLKNNGDGSAEWGTFDIKDKLNKGNLPATIPDAKGIYDLLENNGGLNIDPNLLYLNDVGTKTQGKVYFDRNKKGLFECIQTTTATTNSTTYFVDISNKASSDRLANLIRINGNYQNLILECGTVYEKNQVIVKFKNPFPNKCLGVFFTDFAEDVSSMNRQSIKDITNTGFKYITTFGGYDTAYYLAIGY